MTTFTDASAAAHRCALRSLRKGTPPTIVADALIESGLAVWAAETGRAEHAKRMLLAWTLVRDMKVV